ncbi:MAG: 23S rRNA (adenine(2503)-C(2))-methyltransferase RlmN [Candidatus Omnitrophica bacterium]|nr:23S rRNA (adenine(2503)-C(2))-methyltransferase RlmN [Candidatus Omnitrophota bacterium]
MKQYIHNCSSNEVRAYIVKHGGESYHTTQLFEWLYKKNVRSWDQMTNIPQTLREQLKKDFFLFSLTIEQIYQSREGDSLKYLFSTADGYHIETVLIKSQRRRTLCLSTQVGCKYRCSFCASGKGGFIRNLSVAEEVDQFLLVQNHIGKKVTNVVFMGMGEPLDNYDTTIQTIKVLTREWGIALSERRITVSTVGLIPAIDKFSREGFSQVKLSVSLHATSNEKRKKIMPIAKRYPLKELIALLKKVRKRFKRTITLEYILMKGFNDAPRDAHEIARIAKDVGAKINLIGYNAIKGDTLHVSRRHDMVCFRKRLDGLGAQTTIRYSAGTDITAACGQLRLLTIKQNNL